MRLTPKEPEIGPEDGFTPDNDLFGYAAFGERFANLVGSIEEPPRAGFGLDGCAAFPSARLRALNS